MSSVTFVYFKTSMQVIPLSSLILDVQEEDEHMAWSAFGGLWVTHHNEGNTFGWASGITVSIPLNKKWGTEVAITYKNQVTKVSFILLLLIKLANQNTLQTLLTRKLSFWTFFFITWTIDSSQNLHVICEHVVFRSLFLCIQNWWPKPLGFYND